MLQAIYTTYFMLSFAWTQPRPYLHHISAHVEEMDFALTGVYVDGETLCYRLLVANHSHLIYDVDQLRFCIRDRRKVRRHAYQEVFPEPLWIRGDTRGVGPGETKIWWIGLPKEVLSNKEFLQIDLLERRGGRNLQLHVGYRTILGARVVNELQLLGSHTSE
jgi:hypothetical protein